MKPAPSPVLAPESQPSRLSMRARLRALFGAVGRWGKRLAQGGQPDQSAPAPSIRRAAAPDAKTLAGAFGESPRAQRPAVETERAPTKSRPIRRVGAPQTRGALREGRPYLTEGLAARNSAPAYASARPTNGQVHQTDQPDAPLASAAPEVFGLLPVSEGTTPPASALPSPDELPAEPPVEQSEETRRALTRKLLRGTRNGMLLTLEPGYAWAQVVEALTARLEESPSFFQGSVLSLDTRRRPLQPAEMDQLEALLAPYDMIYKEVGSDELNDPRILPSGAVRELPDSGAATLPIRAGRDATNTLLTRRTIRSGQRLRYDHSVIIMGDVNSGAEVIAGGDVLVWGTLRGTVHAGYPGNEKAVVCALALAPVQLRIGALASRPPDDESIPPQTPEVASVKNGQIVVESWNAGRALLR